MPSPRANNMKHLSKDAIADLKRMIEQEGVHVPYTMKGLHDNYTHYYLMGYMQCKLDEIAQRTAAQKAIREFNNQRKLRNERS